MQGQPPGCPLERSATVVPQVELVDVAAPLALRGRAALQGPR